MTVHKEGVRCLVWKSQMFVLFGISTSGPECTEMRTALLVFTLSPCRQICSNVLFVSDNPFAGIKGSTAL